MREIKLRAWDLAMLCMIEEEDLQLMVWDDYIICPRDVGDGTMRSHPLMQWTGLKDKNGVDIYEGDILGVDGESFGAVNWCEDCAAWGIGSKDLMLCEYAYSKFEVIGNIHQNPELLDGC